MKLGTPGFVPERLRQAREARGLNATALAELVGVSRQAVSQYENGVQTPSPEVMRQIVSTLHLPEAYFRWQMKPEPSVVYYRSLAAATKTARRRAQRKLAWLQEIVVYLQQYVEFPRVDFPIFDVPSAPAQISNMDIEDLALQTRRYFGLGDGPISNTIALTENHGAITTRLDLGADTLDALSTRDSFTGAPLIVLGLGRGSAVRSRFDVAHELGHIVLHNNVVPSLITKSSEHALMEQQAHKFASAFLLPMESFCGEMYSLSLDALVTAKERWRVSMGAMIMRLGEAGVIGEDNAQRLWANYARRGWKRGEPLDDQLLSEEPRVVRRALEVLVGSGVSTSEVLADIRLSARDVETLAGLPDGWMASGPQTRGSTLIPFRGPLDSSK